MALRKWAISVFGGAEPHGALPSAPHVSAGAARHFFATELCAAPLLARLGADADRLFPDGSASLRDAARAETQRVLSARALLAELDAIADAVGVSPIVLKGGVAAVAGPEPVDLGDIDLVVRTAELETLGQALENRGFTKDPYQPSYSTPDALHIELQDVLYVGYGIEPVTTLDNAPIPGFRRLRRLTPVGHAAHAIQHSTTAHASRRGHLRDLVLIAGALGACSAADRTALRDALLRSPASDVYLAALDMAAAFIAHAPASDPFEFMAACKYVTALWWPNGPGRLFVAHHEHAAFFAASLADARRLSAGYLFGPAELYSHWYSHGLARHSPAAAAALAIAARTPYRIVETAYAAASAAAIARRARRAIAAASALR